MSKRSIKVYRELSGENAKWAESNRKLLSDSGTVMLNLIGSPGCGKTKLLESLAEHLPGRFAVLEGDIETTRDAERLDAVNIMVSQLVTGGACHLAAKLVHHGL
ncbi:unnamed protein product, partial [marine sediment metagenome]